MSAAPVGVGFAASAMLASFQLDPDSYGGFDEADFTAKLLALGPAADHALVTALARWWAGEHVHSVAGWAAVGLTVTGETATDDD